MSSTQALTVRDEAAARRKQVAEAFGTQGLLASRVSGFVARPSQLEMALAVFDAIVDRATLVAEAGTGTGKTFAYLVPSLLAGGKTLISVGTKTLQDQVYEKDLRLVCDALGLAPEIALLKGRQNYVCLHRLDRSLTQALLPSRAAAAQLRQIERFARLSTTGDRSQLPAVPESAGVWHEATSTQDNCLGAECPRFDDCFVYKARRRALAADVVVVNHHLFLADMVLRDDRFGELLPSVDTVVLDEAHHLPRVGAEFFGQSWSLAQVADLASDARMAALRAARDGAAWVDLTRGVERQGQAVRLALAECGLGAGARSALERLQGRETLVQALVALDRSFAELEAAVHANSGRDPDLDAIGPRIERLRASVADWMTDPPERGDGGEGVEGVEGGQSGEGAEGGRAPDVVRWVATSTHGAQFQATPLSAADSFARARERSPQAWILTSATLTVAGRFDAFVAEIGLQAVTRRWESPFDYGRQALLYLPDPMPLPAGSRFPEQVAEAAWPLIRASAGRAFVLCSTLRAVDRIAAALRQRISDEDVELELLVQGEATRSSLLQSFRDSGRAVLVGSVSFWEGIDVRGRALSLVVIDKLPFAPPDDPLVEARIRSLRAAGRNPFTEFQLPQAVTLLKQGAGRLIRDERDRGVLMIVDGRVLGKSYGKIVIDSLPPFRLTRDESAACAFLSET
jgi:ATP-dependent DNA helicase DinG